METIYFLIAVGVCAFAVVWVTRASKAKTNLARKRKITSSRQVSEKLATPADNRLSHREKIWEQRQNLSATGFIEKQTFVLKSEAGTAPEYDGYSRRGRHHVAPTGTVKEEAHISDKNEFAMSSTQFKRGDHATQT